MIAQYLPQTNESTAVAKSKKFSLINKALAEHARTVAQTGRNQRFKLQLNME